jgi:hypothetical protein
MEFPQTYDSLLHWARTVVPGTRLVIYKGMLGGSFTDGVSHKEFYGTTDRTRKHCFPLKAIVQKTEEFSDIPLTATEISIWIGPSAGDKFNRLDPYLLRIHFHNTCARRNIARSWIFQLKHNTGIENVTQTFTSYFNRESLTVISLPPFIKDVVTRATARAYSAERAAFGETLALYGAVPRGMAADLALMMFPE